MERKDRVTDWAIGIFFVTLVAYAELLREQVPSIWRVSLIIGLSCFIMRLFMNSCLAYAYLKKWRYLLDLVEKHWMTSTISLDFVKKEIGKYHYTPRTTERPIYFIKSQLLAGFFILFLFPFSILLLELHSNPLDLYTIIPISFLVAYYFLELILFYGHKALEIPADDKNANSKFS